MKYEVRTKRAGNIARVRKSRSGKGFEQVVAFIPDGTMIDGELTKDKQWVKTDAGYIMASLCKAKPKG